MNYDRRAAKTVRKPGERVIDKPGLPAGGITRENGVHTDW